MSKLWNVAQHDFLQQVMKRSFLLVLLSLPLFLSLTVGIGYLSSRTGQKHTRLGYVDQAGVLAETRGDSTQLLAFQNTDDARAALEAGRIDAYYVIPASYAQTRRAELVYYQEPPYAAQRAFYNAVRRNLLAGQSPMVIERALAGANMTARSLETGRDYPQGGPSAGQALPVLLAIIFAFLTMTTSTYLMEALVAEKENRTIEVVISSISPAQLMQGKIIGALGIALMQLLVWTVFLAGAAWLGGHVLNVAWLRDVRPDVRGLLLLSAVALLAYVFIAALMTTVGTTLVENQEVQQVGPLFFLLFLLPIYLLIPLAQHPNGTLAIGASLFPPTAAMTLALRGLFSQVPLWQFLLSALVGLLGTAFMIRLAGRAFRVNMLRYGRRLVWRDVFAPSQRTAAQTPANRR